MLAAISFNNQPGLEVNEIDNIGANGLLPPEFGTSQLPIP